LENIVKISVLQDLSTDSVKFLSDASATKKEVVVFVGKMDELEMIMLSEISHTQEEKCHVLSFVCGI
jgi:hypothetical protein